MLMQHDFKVVDNAPGINIPRTCQSTFATKKAGAGQFLKCTRFPALQQQVHFSEVHSVTRSGTGCAAGSAKETRFKSRDCPENSFIQMVITAVQVDQFRFLRAISPFIYFHDPDFPRYCNTDNAADLPWLTASGMEAGPQQVPATNTPGDELKPGFRNLSGTSMNPA